MTLQEEAAVEAAETEAEASRSKAARALAKAMRAHMDAGQGEQALSLAEGEEVLGGKASSAAVQMCML